MMPYEFKPGVSADRVSAQEGYDRWSEIYDSEDNSLIALDEQFTPPLLGDVTALQVVDLGCGTGRVSLRLAGAGAQVTAVDFSEGMVEKARSKPAWSRVRFISHDLSKPLPFPDAAFDRVVSALVLEHLSNLDLYFRECKRICRPDGCIIHSTMHPAMFLRGVSAHFTDPATGRDVAPASLPYQISDFVMAATRAGLKINHLSEHAVDEALAARSRRAEKYLHWPMLLVMRLKP